MCGPGGNRTRTTACQERSATANTTGPGPRNHSKTKRILLQGFFLLTGG